MPLQSRLDKVSLKSKQTIFSILAGIIIGVLICIFLTPTFWGPLVGVFVAAYFAKAASPKEGAIIGAIVVVLVGRIYTFLQFHTFAKTPISIAGAVVGLLLIAGVGALNGLIVGKLFQTARELPLFNFKSRFPK